MTKNINTFLKEAEDIYSSQESNTLLEFLLPHQDAYEILDSKNNIRFNRLLAYAYAFKNKLNEAETHCTECIKIEAHPLDHYFVLTYVYLTLREYKKALYFSGRYLTSCNKMKLPDYNYSFNEYSKSQVYFFMGTSYVELRDFENAVISFTKAISIFPENHLPYLHTANMYINQKQYDKAQLIIQLGLKSCSQNQELRLLEKSIMSETHTNKDKKDSLIEDYTLISLLADSCKKEGNYKMAIQHYESLLHFEPNNIGNLYLLSECYLLMGHRDSAIIGFKRILDLDLNFKPAQKQLERLTKPVLSS